MIVKKHGRYPYNGGGIKVIKFQKCDIQFIVKAINDNDFNGSYNIYLTTTNNLYRTDGGKIAIRDNSRLMKNF